MDTANSTWTTREDWTEDLAALAALAFRTAQSDCAACGDYHALWTYLRLAGMIGGDVRSDGAVIDGLLHDHTPPDGRVLIAGAADAGLLALTARAIASRSPQLTVADRCATPLALCRHYAGGYDLPILTMKADLAKAPCAGAYHVAFAHYILRHMDPAHHVAFLGNLRRVLRPGGIVILADRAGSPTWMKKLPMPALYAARVMDALSTRNVALPEDEAAFRRRLEIFSAAQSGRLDKIVGQSDVESSLEQAGFDIVQRVDRDRGPAAPAAKTALPSPITAYIFVARARDTR